MLKSDFFLTRVKFFSFYSFAYFKSNDSQQKDQWMLKNKFYNSCRSQIAESRTEFVIKSLNHLQAKDVRLFLMSQILFSFFLFIFAVRDAQNKFPSPICRAIHLARL